jgi:hypothetical protein
MRSAEFEQYVRCLAAGEPDFVPKPIHVAEVFEVLGHVLGCRVIFDSRSFLKFRVLTSSGRRRTSPHPFTGATLSFPVPDPAVALRLE